MRRIFEEVVEGARDMLLSLREEMKAHDGLTDEEAMVRYVTEHRGRPEKMLEFTEAAQPDSDDKIQAAVEYESVMEDALKRRRGRRNASS